MTKRTYMGLAAGLALVLCLSALLPLASCGSSGGYLDTVSSGGFDFALYGYISGIRRIIVTRTDGTDGDDAGDGEALSNLEVAPRRGGEPYAHGDGMNYGFTLTDLNADGNADIAVCRFRTEGREEYAFFLGDGKGGFTYEKRASELISPRFGGGDGTLSVTSHTRVDELKYTANAPDRYTETEDVTVWGWNTEGDFTIIKRTALIFYSENDIYCFTTYSPASPDAPETDAPGGLMIVSEEWIRPENLASHGFSPFGSAASASGTP